MRVVRIGTVAAEAMDHDASRALSAVARMLRRAHTLVDSDVRVVVLCVQQACGRWMQGVRR